MLKRNFLKDNKSILTKKLTESLISTLPITVSVLILAFIFIPIESGAFLSFILGAILLILGMALFSLGVDMSMNPIGNYVGSSIMSTKKLWIIIPAYLILGVLITISEPDLQVLAGQLSETVGYWTLIISVGIGVGIFLVFAVLRMLLKIKLKVVLLFFYVIVIGISFFVDKSFLPIAFDAGGVTTGPISVPFIIAIGTGFVALRNDKSSISDSFGLTAMCSIGPILSVMILSLIFNTDGIVRTPIELDVVNNSVDLFSMYLGEIPTYLLEVLIGLLPICLFFFITLIFGNKISKSEFIKILVGIAYTFIGLVLFLVGVNVGFLPMGKFIGSFVAESDFAFLIIPIGAVLGFVVVLAEPAVQVLKRQVYDITSGAIPTKALSLSLMIGVSLSVALSMACIYFDISVYYLLLGGYLIAFILTFFSPDIFTAIAFDSGGVASGAMTASFILPISLGYSEVSGSLTYGFGVVAMVALTPLITISVLGIIYKIINNKNKSTGVKKSRFKEKIIG